jgi:hypothetical protein
MKCSKAVEDYLKLENNSHTPFVLKFHIMFCRGCRNEVLRIKKIFHQLKEDSVYKSPFDIKTSVMDIIRSESVYVVKTISGFKWFTIGLIIFLSILLINFSDSFLWLKKEFGSNYTLPMSIVMGFIFTAYSAVLIGCNYESIKKYLELHYRWKIK